MSALTINTFPSMNSFTNPRAWFLAIIVLLHMGFFWALSSGLSIRELAGFAPPMIVELVPETPRTKPEPVPPVVETFQRERIYTPTPKLPPFPEENQRNTAPEQVTSVPSPAAEEHGRPEPGPVIVEPQIDPRIGLSEPPYPAAAIRNNETGMVLLSVQVLENGRVGAVRIEQSSGYARLDEAAAREARRWRLRPGMRDGVPVTMWKQIPIRFQLNEAVRF